MTIQQLWNEGIRYYQSDRFDLALDRFIKAAALGHEGARTTFIELKEYLKQHNFPC